MIGYYLSGTAQDKTAHNESLSEQCMAQVLLFFWLESTNGSSADSPGDLVGEDDSIFNFAR